MSPFLLQRYVFFAKEPYKEVEINLKITLKYGTDYADYTDLWFSFE